MLRLLLLVVVQIQINVENKVLILFWCLSLCYELQLKWNEMLSTDFIKYHKGGINNLVTS